MAIALTLQNTKISSQGNISALYLATMTGTYPSGGYTVNAAVYPDATARFSSLKRIRFERDSGIDANLNFYRATNIDNSSATDPTFKLRCYEMATGGTGLQEITAGTANATSVYVEIEGIPLNGVNGDNF